MRYGRFALGAPAIDNCCFVERHPLVEGGVPERQALGVPAGVEAVVVEHMHEGARCLRCVACGRCDQVEVLWNDGLQECVHLGYEDLAAIGGPNNAGYFADVDVPQEGACNGRALLALIVRARDYRGADV